MNGANNFPTNLREKEFIAQLEPESKQKRTSKPTDVLVFSRIGKATFEVDGIGFRKATFFKGISKGFFTNIFNYKANAKDVMDIFQTNGMSKDQAARALENVKNDSKQHKISGLSAQSVKNEIKTFQESKVS